MPRVTRKIAIQRLLRVKRQILKDPEILIMHSWICGTAACIGGHLALNEGFIPDDHNYAAVRKPRGRKSYGVYQTACKLLGLKTIAGLIEADLWPSGIGKLYRNTTRPATRAKYAAMAIDQFIADNLQTSNKKLIKS